MGITAGELQSQLEDIDDDKEVKVIVREHGVGPTPSVGIDSINVGFDWDHDIILMKPEEGLRVAENLTDYDNIDLSQLYKEINRAEFMAERVSGDKYFEDELNNALDNIREEVEI